MPVSRLPHPSAFRPPPPRLRRLRRGGCRRRVRHPFWTGVLEALLLPLLFVAAGLSTWAVARPADGGARPYPPVLVESLPPADAAPRRPPGPPSGAPPPRVWLVDGFNVLQVALLGGQDRSAWWTRPRREALLARVAAFQPAAQPAAGEEPVVWVVFDGRRPLQGEEGPPFVVFAPSADEWILDRIRAAAAPERIALVSADRRLTARARGRGARIVAPAAFLERCPVRGETASV